VPELVVVLPEPEVFRMEDPPVVEPASPPLLDVAMLVAVLPDDSDAVCPDELEAVLAEEAAAVLPDELLVVVRAGAQASKPAPIGLQAVQPLDGSRKLRSRLPLGSMEKTSALPSPRTQPIGSEAAT
jgi:hypothetical protein